MLWNLFLMTLLKINSNTGVFLENLRIVKSTFLYRTPLVTASGQPFCEMVSFNVSFGDSLLKIQRIIEVCYGIFKLKATWF